MPALDGMRILDLTQYEAGPAATQALAWLGAEVVKVEPPGTGEPGRTLATNYDPSPYFLSYNANKRSVALDLSQAEGRELLLRLVPRYDVFVENYGPGVMDRLGFDYESLRALHPELIYASVKGFGSSGPYADYKCFDMIAQAAAGAFSVTGEVDGRPMRPGPTIADTGTGVQLALAITAAYVQRLQTGKGQHIELSMQEAMTYFMRTMISYGQLRGLRPTPRTGNQVGSAEIDLYPCKPFGPNDYIYICSVTPRMWETLCKTMGRPELLRAPRFETAPDRAENGEALGAEIEAWTRQHEKFEAMHLLADAGIPCSAVFDTEDVLNDPHLKERGFVRTVQHPEVGELELLGCPMHLSESDVPLREAPELGEGSVDILTRDLDLEVGELEALLKSGVVAKPGS